MKKLLLAFAFAFTLAAVTPDALGQGEVNFGNSSNSRITLNPGGEFISGGAGRYYFGLFIAEPGEKDLSKFTFTGCFATNLAVAGRIRGDVITTSPGIAVPGWESGASKSFFIVGWSAENGKDARAANAARDFASGAGKFHEGMLTGFAGASTIGTVRAGGGALPIPTLFGSPPERVPGFALNQIPILDVVISNPTSAPARTSAPTPIPTSMPAITSAPAGPPDSPGASAMIIIAVVIVVIAGATLVFLRWRRG